MKIEKLLAIGFIRKIKYLDWLEAINILMDVILVTGE